MRILYLSNGSLPDYQCDTVFHGLRSLEGDNVVDYRRVWYMYADSFGEGKANLSELYGRGFSMFGLLGSDKNVDRTDIIEKIKAKFWDLIVWGSIQRNQAYFGGITSVYDPSRLVGIDGEDYPGAPVLQDKMWYFKREFAGTGDGIYPIEFGLPKEKFLSSRPTKTRFMAEYDPLIHRAYKYETESEYYQSYAESYFAPTMRKSGFCCLRHYEILANWTMPYFRMIDAMPPTIMTRFPKTECNIIRQLIEHSPEGCDSAIDFYDRIIEKVMKHVRENLTTEAIAKYVLDTVAANK
jgi:hypothetical protein